MAGKPWREGALLWCFLSALWYLGLAVWSALDDDQLGFWVCAGFANGCVIALLALSRR